jgi:hypothetical protein
MVEWHDEATLPWEMGSGPSQFPRERPTRQSVRDRAVVNWRPNQVWITPRDAGLAGVTLVLTNNVLQFSHYEYRVIDVNGAAGPWRSHASPELSWQPSGPEVRLEVRGVNVRGSAGPASAVAVGSQTNTSPAPSVYSSELHRPEP